MSDIKSKKDKDKDKEKSKKLSKTDSKGGKRARSTTSIAEESNSGHEIPTLTQSLAPPHTHSLASQSGDIGDPKKEKKLPAQTSLISRMFPGKNRSSSMIHLDGAEPRKSIATTAPPDGPSSPRASVSLKIRSPSPKPDERKRKGSFGDVGDHSSQQEEEIKLRKGNKWKKMFSVFRATKTTHSSDEHAPVPEEHSEEYFSNKQELTTLKETNKEMKEKLELVNNEKQDLANQLATKTKGELASQKQISELQEELNSVKTELQNQKSGGKQALEKYKKQIIELKEQLEEEKIEKNGLLEDKKVLDQQVDRLTRQVKSFEMSKDASKSSDHTDQLHDELVHLKTQVDEEVRQREEAEKNSQKYQRDLQVMKELVDDLNSKLEDEKY